MKSWTLERSAAFHLWDSLAVSADVAEISCLWSPVRLPMARSSWIHPPLAPGEHYCSVPPSLSRICEVQWQRNIHSHTLSHSHTQAHIHTAGRLFIHVSILTFLKLYEYVSLCYLALCVFPVPYYWLVSVPLWPLPHSQWFKPSPSRACCDCASVVVFCSVFPALAAFLFLY